MTWILSELTFKKRKEKKKGYLKPVLCENLEGWMGREVEVVFRLEGTHVYLWPMYGKTIIML